MTTRRSPTRNTDSLGCCQYQYHMRTTLTYIICPTYCHSIVLCQSLVNVIVLLTSSESCGHVSYVLGTRLGTVFLVELQAFHVMRVNTAFVRTSTWVPRKGTNLQHCAARCAPALRRVSGQ